MSTLRVASAHFKTDRWLRPQIDYLARFSSLPVELYAHFDGVDPGPWRDEFHLISTDDLGDAVGSSQTGLELNHLYELVVDDPETKDDDYLAFLDSDAFPIRPLDPRAVLGDHQLAAVRRDEFNAATSVHPSFAVASIRIWKDLGPDWRVRDDWRSDGPYQPDSDVGCLVRDRLRERNVPWRPLLRSNRTNLDPLAYGVYGDVVYHHGFGSRTRMRRGSLQARVRGMWKRPLPPPSRRAGLAQAQRAYRGLRYRSLSGLYKRMAARHDDQSEMVYRWIRTDEDFVLRFCPGLD